MIEPINWVKKKFIEVVVKLTPHCHDVPRFLSESTERPLPLPGRLLIRLHFSICVWCQRYGQHLESLRKFSAEFPDKGCKQGEAKLSLEARKRLGKALQESDR